MKVQVQTYSILFKKNHSKLHSPGGERNEVSKMKESQ